MIPAHLIGSCPALPPAEGIAALRRRLDEGGGAGDLATSDVRSLLAEHDRLRGLVDAATERGEVLAARREAAVERRHEAAARGAQHVADALTRERDMLRRRLAATEAERDGVALRIGAAMDLHEATAGECVEAARGLAGECARLRAEVDGLREAIGSAHTAMTTNPRDWARDKHDAWLYGVVVGWEEALPAVARHHRWGIADGERLQRYAEAIGQLQAQGSPVEGAPALGDRVELIATRQRSGLPVPPGSLGRVTAEGSTGLVSEVLWDAGPRSLCRHDELRKVSP